MKTKGTPFFFMKKSLNTGVVIDLEILELFKKYVKNISNHYVLN